MSSVATKPYVVGGMMCDDCVATIRSRVADVPGVLAVGGHWPTGRVRVLAETIDDEAIVHALEDAGFRPAA